MSTLLRNFAVEKGILKDGKLSAGGLCNFLFQAVFLFLAFSFMFRPQFGPLVAAWNPLIACLLGVGCIVSLHVAYKLVLGLYEKLGGDQDGKPVTTTGNFLVHSARALLFVVIMLAMPGLMLLALNYCLPGYFVLKGVSEAFTCGFMLVAGDMLIGTLTGVRLLLPEPRKSAPAKSDSSK